MRDSTATRTRIAEVALGLFVEKGVDATGIRDIATGAGVAEGALYRHFAGKDALVWALFSTNYYAFAAELDALQQAHTGLSAKLAAMVEGFCALYDRQPTLFRFLLLAQHGQLAKVPDDAATPVTVVRDVLAEAMARGEIGGEPDFATALVMGVVLQTATFHVYGRLQGPLCGRAAALAEACRRVVGA